MSYQPYTREEFIQKYTPFIQKVTKGTGVFPGTVISAAIFESSGDYQTGGKWRVGGSKLSQKSNNFFGIKHTTSGERYVIKSNFRVYPSVKDSIRDYVRFLQDNPRYSKAGVFKAKSVEEQFARLKEAGYATATNYVPKLVGVYKSIKSKMFAAMEKAKENWIPITIGFVAIAGLSVYLISRKRK
jgi:flagellum-specific peptidoglycan hydrolase FlgJ